MTLGTIKNTEFQQKMEDSHPFFSCETASVVCSFYLNVVAHEIVWADPLLR